MNHMTPDAAYLRVPYLSGPPQSAKADYFVRTS